MARRQGDEELSIYVFLVYVILLGCRELSQRMPLAAAPNRPPPRPPNLPPAQQRTAAHLILENE